MKEKRIHIDTLQYTRDGLATKDPIGLSVGEHNRIVLVRPERRVSLPFGSGSFGLESCFPTPGVLSVCMRAAAQNTVNFALGLSPKSIFQVYGHAEPSGDDASNKALSERRAQVMLACLTGDFTTVQGLAASEEWGTYEHQVMLRTLGCDPGAIDAEPGPVTERAARLFQFEYAHGVFHRHLPEHEPAESLEQDGSIQGATLRALLEAYVLCVSPMLQPQQVHPTHPAVGCSEFNRVDLEQDAYNRRVSLVVHPELPPHHDAAPCTAGDHAACPVDDREPHARCLWYREHVLDPNLSALKHHHFDLRWLPLANGKLLLSALTTLPDGEPIEFQAFESQPVSAAEQVGPQTLGRKLSEPMQGLIRGGVAQVVWEPPQDYNTMLTGLAQQDGDQGDPRSAAEHFAATPRVKIPVFVCRGADVMTVSSPPGRELVRLPPKASAESDDDASGFSGVDWFGNVYQVASHDQPRGAAHLHPLREGEPVTWHVRHIDHPSAQEDAS